ncbi:hypothetical protein GQ457_15G029290 [Hibiscus cannabinus]
MHMVYKRLWLPLSVLKGILLWAENKRRDRYEYQTRRWVCYGLSLFMVHESYWVLLLGPILYFIWGESIIRWYGDVGEDGNDKSFQDIGKDQDQDGCDIIIVSEVGVEVGDATFRDLFSCHNMDVYLHGVAIKDIQANVPVKQLDHDIALVNKHSGRVRDDYGLPPNWWADEDRRGMVQREKDGRWSAQPWLLESQLIHIIINKFWKEERKGVMDDAIARRWRELSGENNWEGLLQPLDPDLRRYIIHYGQMVGAVADLFNSNTYQPDASEEDFFSKACLVQGNPYEYKVSRFIYAGSQSVDSAWIGYVAVATDRGRDVLGRRDILIAWRGTATTSEWNNNFQVTQGATDLFPGRTDVKVHQGFYSLYTGTKPDSDHNKTSARDQVLEAVKGLVDRYKGEEIISITVTGFSLGAALATLTAVDIANGYNKTTTGKSEPVMVTAFTFGCPRVVNTEFAREFNTLCDDHRLHLLRIENEDDFIPRIPWECLSYTSLGNTLVVNSSVSIYLKRGLSLDYSCSLPSLRKRYEYEARDNLFVVLTLLAYMWLLPQWLALLLFLVVTIIMPEKKSDGDELYGVEDEDKKGFEFRFTISFGDGFEPIHTGMSKGSKFRQKYSGHNMDVYLHGVAIKDIRENSTRADELHHDIALVNKHLDRVKAKYRIPSSWWAGENRNRMLQSENGRWMVV